MAEVPGSGWSPLPQRGTLYFFCSSMFVGEGHPPRHVVYSPADGNWHSSVGGVLHFWVNRECA
nr:hypothetical protein [Bradyrhizobium sp. 199]